jgi:ketosteroid isomerase-like protein
MTHACTPRLRRSRCIAGRGRRAGRVYLAPAESPPPVIVVWDGRGTTTAGTTYHNTYAWFMTLSGGTVIDGTAFCDSIAFDELWDRVTP